MVKNAKIVVKYAKCQNLFRLIFEELLLLSKYESE